MTLKKQTILAYSFLTPILLFYSIFLVIPVVFSLIISFTDWSGYSLDTMKWVGLNNYKEILSGNSTYRYPILTNTMIFAVGTVAISCCSALAISFFISRTRAQGFWRTIYFLPSVTTIVAVGNVWLYMYEPSNGLINGLLTRLGFQAVNFLDNPDTALMSVVFVSGWMGIGTSVLLISAGMKGIPEDYYEAASLEGAGIARQYFSITFPLLKPTFLFVMITSLINGLQSFTLTMIMTKNGGPGNATNVAALEMYNQAFSFGKWGTASAMAFVLFIFIFVITLAQLLIFRKGGVESY